MATNFKSMLVTMMLAKVTTMMKTMMMKTKFDVDNDDED